MQQAAQVEPPPAKGHVLLAEPHLSTEPAFKRLEVVVLKRFRFLSYLFPIKPIKMKKEQKQQAGY